MSYDAPPPPPPGGGNDQGGQPPYGQPPQGGGYGAYPPPPPGGGYGGGGYGQAPVGESKKALWSMIVGILGVTLCCSSLLVPAAALILAVLARNDIAASNGSLGGAGKAKAGLVLGIIGVVISVIWIILVITGNASYTFHTSTN